MTSFSIQTHRGRIGTALTAFLLLGLFAGATYGEIAFATSKPFTLDLRSEGFRDWLATFYSQEDLQDAQVTGSRVDTDGDGSGNLFEYLAKLDPSDLNSNLRLYFIVDPPMRLRLGPRMEGVEYALEYSVDLASWSTVDDLVPVAGAEELEAALTLVSQPSFFRVVVSRAEAP